MYECIPTSSSVILFIFLLRWKLHNQVNHFKVTFSAFTMLSDRHLYLVPRHFIAPKRGFNRSEQSLLVSYFPWPQKPLICFLSLGIYLLWKFCINRTIHHVTFTVWLLPLSIIFLRVIHFGACTTTLILYVNNVSLYNIPYLVYPFIHWFTLGLFLPFGCCK